MNANLMNFFKERLFFLEKKIPMSFQSTVAICLTFFNWINISNQIFILMILFQTSSMKN